MMLISAARTGIDTGSATIFEEDYARYSVGKYFSL